MTIKISALSSAAALTGAELIPAVQSAATVSLTPAQIRTYYDSVTKFAANVGDGTNVNYTINHNLNTRDVHVALYRNVTPWDEVIANVNHLDADNITLGFSSAPSTNQFRVVVRS